MSLSCGTPIYINFCSFKIFLCNLPGEFCPFIKVSLTVCCFLGFKVRRPADRSTAYTLYTDVTLSMCDAHTHWLTLKHTHTHSRGEWVRHKNGNVSDIPAKDSHENHSQCSYWVILHGSMCCYSPVGFLNTVCHALGALISQCTVRSGRAVLMSLMGERLFQFCPLMMLFCQRCCCGSDASASSFLSWINKDLKMWPAWILTAAVTWKDVVILKMVSLQ